MNERDDFPPPRIPRSAAFYRVNKVQRHVRGGGCVMLRVFSVQPWGSGAGSHVLCRLFLRNGGGS